MTATALRSSPPRHLAPPLVAGPRRGALTLDIVRDEAGFYALQPYWDTRIAPALKAGRHAYTLSTLGLAELVVGGVPQRGATCHRRAEEC